ncbi:MAG TPA: nickel transporter permease [Acidimicrobiales bacterium]|nr:nickel transporter permease [Acidimicrobiales bacterium]
MTTVEMTPTEAGALVPEAGAEARTRILRRLLRDRAAVVGLVLVVLVAAAALLAPVISPHDPNAVDVANKFAPRSSEHLLGTDHLGRDMVSRLLWGARLSVGATLVATLGIGLVGLVLGMLAGWWGGFVDGLISRVIELMQALPPLLLPLAITAVLGAGLRNVLIAIVVSSWANYARIVRGAVLAERSKPYVEAARSSGASTGRIFRRHLLPNIVGPVVVMTTLELGIILLAISGLSFLGLGVQPPAAEWGAMLSEGRTYLSRAPAMMVYPGAAIFVMVLAFNLVGDGLRDFLDPRSRRA